MALDERKLQIERKPLHHRAGMTSVKGEEEN